jgi:TRAP-type mannitol/chloroaromatic compound transport system permease large subunit
MVLLVMGMNIGIAMLAVGFFGFWLVRDFAPALGLLKSIPYNKATTYSFTVIPLFVLMGQLAFHSGMSADLFDFANKWLGGRKGGLAMATVAACAGFSAICGSTAATAATMGVVALPEMRKAGYDDSLSAGSIAAGGTLGILIALSFTASLPSSPSESCLRRVLFRELYWRHATSSRYRLWFAANRTWHHQPRSIPGRKNCYRSRVAQR